MTLSIVRRMPGIVSAAALLLIGWVLWDAFETILLPRRVPAQVRFSRFVVRAGWIVWSHIAVRIKKRQRRENFLGFYALLAVLGLFTVWAVGLIVGFAMLQWAVGSPSPDRAASAGSPPTST